TVTNSNFSGNLAQGGSTNVSLTGDILVGAGDGGAICNNFHDVAVSVVISNCTFSNNQAIGGTGNIGGAFTGDGVGGGLANRGGATATVTGTTFTGNGALGGQGSQGGNGTDGLGGACANILGSTLTVSSCTITANSATGGTGGSSANGGNGF